MSNNSFGVDRRREAKRKLPTNNLSDNKRQALIIEILPRIRDQVEWYCRLRRCREHFEDLLSAVMVKVTYAATVWQPERKILFSTYANHWIRSAIGRYWSAVNQRVRTISISQETTNHRTEEAIRKALSREDELPSDDCFVWGLLRCLPPREQMIVRLYVVDGHTLKEIGEMVGVCRERVRQLLTKSFHRLRQQCDKMGITFDEYMEKRC